MITIGLYLATFSTTLPAAHSPESRIESMEIPTGKVYLIENSADPFAQTSV